METSIPEAGQDIGRLKIPCDYWLFPSKAIITLESACVMNDVYLDQV